MTLSPIAAGFEGIVWIIILIFWSIAQYVQKNRAIQRRPPARPEIPNPGPEQSSPIPMDPDLQDLLRELTGQSPARESNTEARQPGPTLKPEPPPIEKTAQPPPAHKRKKKHFRPETPVPGTVPPTPTISMGDIAEGLGAAFASSGKMSGMTMKMPGVSLRSVSYSGSSKQGGARHSPFLLSSLRSRATLRQMVVGRMILDKPKALDTNSGA